MKERLQEALECPVVSQKVKDMMLRVGMEDGSTNYDALAASIVAGAISGQPGYARLLMELIGETGEEKRAERADKRDARRLKMEVEEFQAARTVGDDDGIEVVFRGKEDSSG